jgi:tetratricopeptide (TPR) repeat protein
MIWPVNLSSHYPFPEPLNLSQPMVLVGVIGTFVLLALLVLSLCWTRSVLTGWLIFFVAILPTMQIIGFSDVIASDKFAYLPSIGLLMILAAFLVRLCNNRFLTLCRVSAMIIVLLACAESIAARCYLAYWRDTVSLFEHMLALAPNAVQVHNNLGISLQSLGRNEDAISHFQQALRLKCDYAEAHNNLGVSFQLLDRTDEAIEEYRKAIKIKPDYDRAYNNLGTALGLQGKFDEAIEQFSQALRIKPNCAPAHSNLGNALASIGRFDEAIVQIERAAALTKYQNAAILNILSAAYATKGRFSEAIATAQKALDIAVAGQNNQSADFIRRRLEMYKQGKSSE